MSSSNDLEQLGASPQAIVYRRGTEEFTGWSDFPRALSLLAKAALAALIASVLTSLPLLIRWFPLFVLLQFATGAFLGVALRRALQSMRVRKPSVAIPVLILGTLLTLLLIQAALYLYDGLRLYAAFLRPYPTQSGFIKTLRAIFAFHDTYLLRKTGFSGVLGSVCLHWHNEAYAGFQVVAIVLLPYIAWKLVKGQISAPFCESCGTWMRSPINAAVVHVNLGEYLAQAVESGDAAKAMAVTRAVAGVPLGHGCIVARLFPCASCEAQMVDVVRRGYGGTGRQKRQMTMLEPVSVSGDFAVALRSDPVVAVAPEDSDEPGADGDSPETQEMAAPSEPTTDSRAAK